MVEQIHDRAYESGREQFHAGIDRALERIRCGIVSTFRSVHNVQFAAPWNKQPKKVGCA